MCRGEPGGKAPKLALDTLSGGTGDFADYPTLGIDANALYIGTNRFTAAGASCG